MKIGLIAVGLNTYWHQFGGLRERLDGYRNAIKEKMEAYGGQIVADAGMVDDVDKAHAAAALFRRDEAEVLFIFISTYALSSTLIPLLGEGIPVVLLNLQPAPAIDYARLNGMSDRGEMTGEWLANCQACSLPEFCSVFNRAGTKYDVVTGYLDDAQAWAEIYGWIDAAKVACGMRRNRMGLLGNYYGGMVDVYSDLRLQSTVFGTHAEILEMCELHELRRSVTQREADARVAAFGEAFVIDEGCTREELERAARTSVALDKLAEAHRLGSLVKHGQEVIQWNRTESWVKKEIFNRIERIAEGEGWKEERTGLHENEFIETRRHWFTVPVLHRTDGSVNVLNLVEGREAIVESPTGKFEPFVVHYAETFIVPESVKEYTIRPYGESEGKQCATIKAFVKHNP